jgi:hypothetical protein
MSPFVIAGLDPAIHLCFALSLITGSRRIHAGLEYDPEKWKMVFRKDHAQIKKVERDADATKNWSALVMTLKELQ